MLKPFLHCAAATRSGYLYVSFMFRGMADALMLQQVHGTIKESEVKLVFAVKLRELCCLHEHQFKLQLFSAQVELILHAKFNDLLYVLNKTLSACLNKY
jgi:hypothetical protein